MLAGIGGWRLTGSARRTARTRAGLIIASLILHATILLPIALSPPRPAPTVPDLDLFVLPLDLTPAPAQRRVRRSLAPTDSPPRPRQTGQTASAPSAPTPRLTTPTAPSEPTAATVGVEDDWRVRAGLRPPARLPCPAAPGDRLGQRLCLVGSAPDRDREPETYAEVAPSRRDPSDRNREDGFARQAQANEAWRDYTRGEGAYPGLRSMFRDR